jgi:hypothetical protein
MVTGRNEEMNDWLRLNGVCSGAVLQRFEGVEAEHYAAKSKTASA